MTTKRFRRAFSPEFKQEAVALVTDQGYTTAQAGKAVDVDPKLIGRWKRALEQESSGERIDCDERTELARLRREVRELRMEKEILKKASAFFAKEMK